MTVGSDKLRLLRRIPSVRFDEEMRGYSKSQVDRVLETLAPLADEIETLQNHLEEANARATAATERLDSMPAAEARPVDQPEPDENFDETLRNTLLLAQRTADQTVKQAQAEAEELRRRSTANADSVMAGARAEAKELKGEAHAQREQMLADAESERAQLLADALEHVQSRKQAIEEELMAEHGLRRNELLGEIGQLEQIRDDLHADVARFEEFIAGRRDSVRGAISDIETILDDPSQLAGIDVPDPAEIGLLDADDLAGMEVDSYSISTLETEVEAARAQAEDAAVTPPAEDLDPGEGPADEFADSFDGGDDAGEQSSGGSWLADEPSTPWQSPDAGPSFEGAGPSFQDAGSSFESAGSSFEGAGPSFESGSVGPGPTDPDDDSAAEDDDRPQHQGTVADHSVAQPGDPDWRPFTPDPSPPPPFASEASAVEETDPFATGGYTRNEEYAADTRPESAAGIAASVTQDSVFSSVPETADPAAYTDLGDSGPSDPAGLGIDVDSPFAEEDEQEQRAGMGGLAEQARSRLASRVSRLRDSAVPENTDPGSGPLVGDDALPPPPGEAAQGAAPWAPDLASTSEEHGSGQGVSPGDWDTTPPGRPLHPDARIEELPPDDPILDELRQMTGGEQQATEDETLNRFLSEEPEKGESGGWFGRRRHGG